MWWKYAVVGFCHAFLVQIGYASHSKVGWFANTSKQKVTNPFSPDIPAQPSLQQDEILRASTAQSREAEL